MIFEMTNVTLKDDLQAIFRAPTTEDAAELAAFIKEVCGETDFLLRTADECSETAEDEAKFIQRINDFHDAVALNTIYLTTAA